MSASARNLTPVSSVVALLLAGTLTALTFVDPVYGQNDSVPAASVTEMIARVTAAKPAEVVELKALPMAERLLVEQRYSEAGDLFMALLAKWPGEPAVLYGAALATFNLGRPADAEPLARSAGEILASPDTRTTKSAVVQQRLRGADAFVLLAVILGARGADSEALKSVQRAVALAPEHFDAQFTLGRALYSVGDSAGAVRAFRAALKLKPDDAKALFFLATALEGAGEADGALSAYRDLVARQPRAAEGHLGLGVLLIKRGGADAEKGIQELKLAVGINPDLYEAQVTLGRVLLMRKLAEESVEHLRRAAELAPANPEPHYQLALAYRRLGLNDKAIEETAIVRRIHERRRGDGAQIKSVKSNSRPDQ